MQNRFIVLAKETKKKALTALVRLLVQKINDEKLRISDWKIGLKTSLKLTKGNFGFGTLPMELNTEILQQTASMELDFWCFTKKDEIFGGIVQLDRCVDFKGQTFWCKTYKWIKVLDCLTPTIIVTEYGITILRSPAGDYSYVLTSNRYKNLCDTRL